MSIAGGNRSYTMYLARGSATLVPLKLTSLVTFLFSDKKVTYRGYDTLTDFRMDEMAPFSRRLT